MCAGETVTPPCFPATAVPAGERKATLCCVWAAWDGLLPFHAHVVNWVKAPQTLEGTEKKTVQFVVHDQCLFQPTGLTRKREAPLWDELVLFGLSQAFPRGRLASESNNISPEEEIAKHIFIRYF